MEVILGVDVSSQTLDACLETPKHAKPMFKKVANSSEGCQQLLRWARSHNVIRCVMEATGGNELAIGQRLTQAGIKLYIANPNRIRHFAKGEGILAKTDKVDAFVIAEFDRKSNLPAAFACTTVQLEFKRLIARRIELKQYMRAERCRMRLASATVLQSHEIVIRPWRWRSSALGISSTRSKSSIPISPARSRSSASKKESGEPAPKR